MSRMSDEWEAYKSELHSHIDRDQVRAWFLGVDWAKGSGYNRGEIISKKGNVLEVRFKTLEPVIQLPD